MVGVEVGIASVFVILVLIYAGIHVSVALGLVSFAGVWIYGGSYEVAVSLLAVSVGAKRRQFDGIGRHCLATLLQFAPTRFHEGSDLGTGFIHPTQLRVACGKESAVPAVGWPDPIDGSHRLVVLAR